MGFGTGKVLSLATLLAGCAMHAPPAAQPTPPFPPPAYHFEFRGYATVGDWERASAEYDLFCTGEKNRVGLSSDDQILTHAADGNRYLGTPKEKGLSIIPSFRVLPDSQSIKLLSLVDHGVVEEYRNTLPHAKCALRAENTIIY